MALQKYESKITVRVPANAYAKVRNKLTHGQQTLLISAYVEALAHLIDNNEWDKIIDFLYKAQALELTR